MLKAITIATAMTVTAAGAAYAEKAMSPNHATQNNTILQKKMTPAADVDTNIRTGTTKTTTSTTTNYQDAEIMSSLPAHVTAVSNWYDQNVYDPQENKIGEIKDMLLDREGKVQAVIVSVGGFLGIGEKDVAVAFDSVYPAQRDNKWWLTMNATKDSLKTAPGFHFDRSKGLWSMATR